MRTPRGHVDPHRHRRPPRARHGTRRRVAGGARRRARRARLPETPRLSAHRPDDEHAPARRPRRRFRADRARAPCRRGRRQRADVRRPRIQRRPARSGGAPRSRTRRALRRHVVERRRRDALGAVALRRAAGRRQERRQRELGRRNAAVRCLPHALHGRRRLRDGTAIAREKGRSPRGCAQSRTPRFGVRVRRRLPRGGAPARRAHQRRPAQHFGHPAPVDARHATPPERPCTAPIGAARSSSARRWAARRPMLPLLSSTGSPAQ